MSDYSNEGFVLLSGPTSLEWIEEATVIKGINYTHALLAVAFEIVSIDKSLKMEE